jgi:hypothetical protein
MRRVMMIALASAAAMMSATAANATDATFQQCNGANCVTGTTNVNLQGNVNAPGSLTILGNVGPSTGPVVQFTSTDGLLLDNSGDATIFRDDSRTNLLTQLTFTLLGGASFTKAEFNLENGDTIIDANDLMITLTALGGGTSTFAVNNPTGSNIFDIIAPTGQSYTQASFSTTNGGFVDFKQLRLVLATPSGVPEPATWAMMLLGFGGIGMAMRRSRRSGALMQVA